MLLYLTDILHIAQQRPPVPNWSNINSLPHISAFDALHPQWAGVDTQQDANHRNPQPLPESAPSPTPSELEMDAYADAIRATDKGKKHTSEPSQAPAKPVRTRPEKADSAGKKKCVPKVDKAASKAAAKAGRKPGAVNYSLAEIEALLQLIEKYLPLGPNTWLVVTWEYSQWCKKRGYKDDQDHKSIRTKFAAVHLKAAINEKAGIHSVESGVEDVEGMDSEEVIEISDNSASDSGHDIKPFTKIQKAEKFKVAKAYHSQAPAKAPAPWRTSAATDVLNGISTMMNPASIQQHEQDRLSQTLQFQQILSLQEELRDTRVHINDLRDQLYEQKQRADCAEDQLHFMWSLQRNSPAPTAFSCKHAASPDWDVQEIERDFHSFRDTHSASTSTPFSNTTRALILSPHKHTQYASMEMETDSKSHLEEIEQPEAGPSNNAHQ
ncbi:hypothetical protein HWV62_2753 [Athelia sp. TMB]|nr:hypothetical protein HWV62_2753 [Athelia sp. TMB]